MCGIAAVFAYSGDALPVDRDEVRRMRDRMTARGPDGEGEWFSDDARVGLGHRRLSIIDLSPAGAQPMFNSESFREQAPDRSLAIIFNGEIYNYAELRAQLIAQGYPFQSNSDTEVLLALYATRGEAMLDDLRGMYTFVIWDNKKQELVLARDPFGIKPLYYSDDGKTFRVASQVKALLAGGKINLTPDPAGHVGFFLWGHVPEPFTMFRNIRSLPAGHSMRIGRDGADAPRCFCSISAILRHGGASSREPASLSSVLCPPSSSPDDLLRTALAESVRYHLVADVPVGVFLSAGLDSTTIAAFAAEAHKNLKTVTLGFNEFRGTPDDEVPLAEEVARRLGTDHQTIWVSRDDFENESDNLFDAMDQPSIDGVNTYFVSLAAKRAGLKVAMSGLGGDELFGGYESFRDVPAMARWLRPFRAMPAVGVFLRKMFSPWLGGRVSAKYAGLFEYGSTMPGAYLLRRGLFMPWELSSLLPKEMVRQGWEELNVLGRLEGIANHSVGPPRCGGRTAQRAVPTNDRAKISALELNCYMRNQLLRDSDWAGMAHSVEIRVPLVDIGFFKEIAPLLAGNNPPSKRDLARSAPIEFPDALMNRPKTGFVVPVRDWLRGRQVAADRAKGEARSATRRDGGASSREPAGASADLLTSNSDLLRASEPERGLRGWARKVYSDYISIDHQSGSARFARQD